MMVFNDINEFKQWRLEQMGLIGFVPTMGALHKGHFELVQTSLNETDITIVSIFVNPTQFDNKEDLANYPNSLGDDLNALEDMGVSAVFLPNYEMLYPDDFKYKVTETDLSQKFCGASRPGHFDGVLTVVLKLFNICIPHNVYFGEKDFQQMTLIEGMIEALFLPITLVAVPTVREDSGLALSSRNQRLSDEQKQLAPKLNEVLKNASDAEQAQQQLTELGFKVDYVEDWNHRRLAAAWLGDVRLIDNVEV